MDAYDSTNRSTRETLNLARRIEARLAQECDGWCLDNVPERRQLARWIASQLMTESFMRQHRSKEEPALPSAGSGNG